MTARPSTAAELRSLTFSNLTHAAIHFAGEWGIERAEVLEALALTEHDLKSGAVTDFEPVIEIWALVCARVPHEPIGLRRAIALDPAYFGAMGRATRRVATAREAVQFAVQYQKVFNPLLEASVYERGDRLCLELRHDPRVMANPEWMEFIAGGACKMLRVAAPQAPAPMRVCLAHEPRHDPELYQQVFGTTPQFCAPSYRLEYSQTFCDTGLAAADPDIVPDLQRNLDLSADALSDASPSVSARAAVSLRSRLRSPSGGHLTAVAKDLQMSPRSLQRALRREGTRFRDLLDTTRRTRALELVRRSRLSFREIAEELGYEDPNYFFRAFRSWAGTTPALYRSALIQ